MSSPLAASVSCLNGDDCPATNCAAIMIAKVKMSPQCRCDPIPDTIKTLTQPKSKKQECQHPQEVDRLPWATKVTLTSMRVWKDANEKASNKCKPCSKKQEDLERKTRCCKFKHLRQAPLVASNQGVSERTPGKNEEATYPRSVESPSDEHGLSSQLPRLGPLVVPPPPDEFRRQLSGPIEGLRGTISMFNTTQTEHQYPVKHKDVGE
ncbi:hypothetical protein CK203_103231 [Vitis vinifera]|uniref:Uncharacterized protein n=1 Tax=Vitis vinifera TaxID=29760 RepID=A0A438FHF5_VITVI|nr:hypothetical protein CK203_103231 [Vitis vinifera]